MATDVVGNAARLNGHGDYELDFVLVPEAELRRLRQLEAQYRRARVLKSVRDARYRRRARRERPA
jgi:hypothetical protein